MPHNPKIIPLKKASCCAASQHVVAKPTPARNLK